MTVAAVVVTRGDVSLNPILERLDRFGFDEVVVWDNSLRDDLAVYGRYAAIAETTSDLVYVQDDDCVLEPDAIQALIDAHEPGHVVCNMPPPFRHDFYIDHALVGFGAVFDRDLPQQAFERFTSVPGNVDLAVGRRFNRTCDIVFTGLTPRILADVPYRNLPWAEADTRMYRQPSHVGERSQVLELVRERAAREAFLERCAT